MWGEWRLTLRKAEHALEAGQLERAGSLVSAGDVRSFRQARDLAAQVAAALAARAEEHLKRGDSRRAWRDLEHAERLGGENERIAVLRGELVERKLAEARGFLDAGQPQPALDALAELATRGEAVATNCRSMREAATAWHAGLKEARAGHMVKAIDLIEKARSLAPECDAIQSCLEENQVARGRVAEQEAALHRALAEQNWELALSLAEELLALAPEHAQAQAARRRAWIAVGGVATGAGHARNDARNIANPNGDGRTIIRLRPPILQANAPVEADSDEVRAAEHAEQAGARFLLWVDGVGGYLVCLGDRISIGQPAGWHVDVPIMADLSRLHAWIERDGEGYLLRALRPATVNGRAVKDKAVLRDAADIMLGHGVRLSFHQMTPLSRTALLQLTSPHRLSVAVDAVLLMAETCIIGGISGTHILAPGWLRQVVLFRQGDELWCRTDGGFEVDGQPCHDRARLTFSSRIRGEGFSLALEPLAT